MSVSSPMPAHPLRRHERQQPVEKGLELLAKAEWGVLSLVDADGAPYGVPLSFALDAKIAPQDHHSAGADALPDLIFHAAQEGRKIRCLAHDARAAFAVVGDTEVLPEQFSTRYLSVMACGRLHEVVDEEEKVRLLLRLTSKYSPGLDARAEAYARSAFTKTCVLRLTVENLSVKGRK